jgi:hypothetical protein
LTATGSGGDGWVSRGCKRSGFGDLNQHGPDSIRFYAKTKTMTSRWPSGIKAGAQFSIPAMRPIPLDKYPNLF